MLGNVAFTMLTLLLLLLMAAAGWRLVARMLGVSRRASRHWSVSALTGAAALAFMMAQGTLPQWLAASVGNTLAVLALLALRRGALMFLRQTPFDGEAILLLVVVGVGNPVLSLLPDVDGASGRAVLTLSALVWVLLRMSLQCYPGLRREFGERIAFQLIAPQVAGVALFVVRVAMAFLPGGPGLRPLPVESPVNMAMALLVLLIALLLHASLGLMVVLRLVRKLRHLSQRDALTGVYNRAEWMRQLEVQHRWLGRFGDAYGVLMIDIDHFKKINDTHGHAAGDAVLLSVAQVLGASARDVDVIGRLGGEEFGVLLPRADQVTMRRAAERLRQMLGEADTPWRGQLVRVTVSIGAALCSDPDEPPKALVERADKALYQAKNTGRNRTVVARWAS